MNKLFTVMFVALAATVFAMLPEAALAQSADQAGEDLMQNVLNMMTGSLGTLIGLGIALFGLYMWLIQQSSWGIMVMIGGVALTAFPGIFDWMREGFADATGGEATLSTTQDGIVR